MGDDSCRSCMEYKQGECIGHEICELYRPIPTSGGKDYWPKTMRSRSSYAGSSGSSYVYAKDSKLPKTISTKKKYDPIWHVQVDWKKKDYDKVLGIRRKRADCPKTVTAILRYLDGKVIAWISYEEIQVASGMKYVPKCMLQLNNNTLKIEHEGIEQDPTRAMFHGLLDVTSHITKPCMIFFVVDRPLFDGVKVNTPVRNDDLLCKALTIIVDKKCHLTELVVKDGTGLIKEQIENPVTNIEDCVSKKSKDTIEVKNVEQHDVSELKTGQVEDDDTEIDQELVEKLVKALNPKKNVSKSKKNSNDKTAEKREKQVEKNTVVDGIRIRCRVCNRVFVMSSSEVEFFKKKGFQLPRRCEECRARNIRYSDADYYERGLKHNSYQDSLNMYGPRINVNGGLENSPGYVLKGNKNGKSTYERNFGGKKETIKKRHL
ncbi:Probable zinc-ribbon domain-containing protein [Butyrivibrio hungatei DSM 14810]|uniref:Probable zinc-ribbon domain-containing protein n=1 Tax=Butyrivibrio hungatei DSM 14810 TaxID=1121132 RepID=A0A1M7S601_9FIRM|nr:zinc-ribbon domain containing protein [Butyrivibrio hungatei]SHN53888.1 Probable zinc-ribbon domain-containing protein [Butyrivibrio hungatei DSM 14810]